jgi:leucine-rich repeat transmembrane protein FLRT
MKNYQELMEIKFIFIYIFQVFWIKDGEQIDVKKVINYIISNEGNLIITQARLIDMGNYTCGATNIASTRLGESATLTVYGRS